MNAMVQVPFHGDTIFAIERDNEILVALKPIVEALGLHWRGQRERVLRDSVLSEGVRVIRTPSSGGEQDTTVLPLNLLPGFLFGIDDRRIGDPAIRDKVLAYKRECYQALHAHFFGGADARIEAPDDDAPEHEDVGLLAEARLKLQLVDMARVLRGPPAALALWRRLGLPWVAEMEDVAPTGRAVGESALDAFLTACVRPDAGGRVQSSVLHRAYCAWSAAVGAAPMTATAMGRALKARGIEKKMSNVIWWVGITLVTPEDGAEARH